MDSANDNMVKFNARFDRSLIWRKGGSVRYLLAEVQAPAVSMTEPREHAPDLNLAVVIDASASMKGPPLEAAKKAAIGIVETMRPCDRLSVVSFASDVIVHLPGTQMIEANKASAIDAIASLHTRGCTNLAAGWLEGAECVATHAEANVGCQNRVVLLSDGHANEGLTDPAELARIADDLRVRGVFSSTVGIGNGYSPIQLQAIAEAGGGRMHDAERPEEIIEVVTAELMEIYETAVENVTICVDGPDNLAVEPFGSYRVQQEGTAISVNIGSLLPGAKRQLVVKFMAPACTTTPEYEVTASATWTIPGDDRVQSSAKVLCPLRHATGRRNSAQERDFAASVDIAKIWQAQIVRVATSLNMDRDLYRSQQYVSHQLRFFERYCEDLPGVERLVNELYRLRSVADREMSPRASKEAMLMSHKSSRGESDRRVVMCRAPWIDHLE
jgi:Ca-activated chloride channel family protein